MFDFFCMTYFDKSFQVTTMPVNFCAVLFKDCSFSKAAMLPPMGVWNSSLLKRDAFDASIKLCVPSNFTRYVFSIPSFFNTSDFLKDSSILRSKRKFYAKEAEGLGGKVDMKATVIKEVKVGPYKFRNVPVYVFDDVYNVTSYPYLGGILGNDLLRRFNIILNYDHRDIYITPNSHFNEQFDYAYTGIELYNINGLIVVGDVADGSPAEKSGLKEGDIVIGVNKTFDQNLSHYKSALQTPGERIKLVIRRKDSLMEFNFKVKSIL